MSIFNIKLEEQDFSSLDWNLESTVDNFIDEYDKVTDAAISDEEYMRAYAKLKDVNLEGVVGFAKRLWIRFKQLIAMITNLSKKVWLRFVIMLSRSDGKLTEYKRKAEKAIMIPSKDKEDLKDVLEKYCVLYEIGFPINKNIDVKELYTDKHYDTVRDIIRYIKTPNDKTVDFLTDKSHLNYIAIDDDLMYLTAISKSHNSNKYAKTYKESIDIDFYNKCKKEMYQDIDTGDVTNLKELFKNVTDYSTLKEMIYSGSKMMDGYNNRASKLSDGSTDDTKRLKYKYEIYTAEANYIYYTIKHNISMVKTALKAGAILFD